MSPRLPVMRDLPDSWFTRVRPRVILSSGKVATVEVVNLHPHGATLRVTPELKAEMPLAHQVELRFEKEETTTCFVVQSAVVRDHARVEGQPEADLISVVFLKLTEQTADWTSEETIPEVVCPEDFLPLAWGRHPWFFNYRLQFGVLAFRNGGMRMRFPRGSRGLMEGLVLELQLVLPAVEIFALRVKVRHVRLQAEESHGICTVDFLDEGGAAGALRTGIARYLLMTRTDEALARLDALELPFPDLDFASVLEIMSSPRDRAEVMALRLQAYQQRPGSTLVNEADPEVMADRFDEHALILKMRLGSRPIGTARLVLNDGDRHRSEVAQFVEIPEKFWQAGFVEFSRVATVERVRGHDVFPNLMRHLIRIAFQCGFPYMISDCEGHLLEPYKRRGAQELGIQFVHPLEGKLLHVLSYDVGAILKGQQGDASLWGTFWRPMVDFLAERHGDSWLQQP